TQRTNQFNFTTRRRSETELAVKLPSLKSKIQGRPSFPSPMLLDARTEPTADAFEALTVTVSDRFGDYGLVGVLIHESTATALVVDTFLLSCRVLGRGVEYRMLARLGEIACARRLGCVDLHFIQSSRNKPALDFLESIASRFRQTFNGGY